MNLPRNLKEAKKDKKNLTSEEIYAILGSYIVEQIDLSRRKQESEDSFDSPSWSEKQAYQLGLIKGLNKVLSFIPLTKGNEDV